MQATVTPTRTSLWPWDVVTSPLIDGNTLERVPSAKVVKRQNLASPRHLGQEQLGVVGADQALLTNAELSALIHDLPGQLVDCGELKGGRIVWAQVLLRQDSVDLGETYEFRVTLWNRHDGKGCLVASLFGVRVFCVNQTSAVTGNAVVRIPHTKGMHDRLEILRAAWAGFQDASNSEIDLVRTLAGFTQHEESRNRYFEYVASRHSDSERVQKSLVEGFQEAYFHETNRPLENTLWRAVNAVTWYADHSTRVRATAQQDEFQARTYSNLLGPAMALKELAFRVAKGWAKF